MKAISGFSKLSKQEKIDYLINEFFTSKSNDIAENSNLIKSFWHSDENRQKVFDEFSENTLTNFYFPYGVVPNLLLNEKIYCVPMVIEESSVVAAASRSAKYWLSRGGFKSEVINDEKVGQVHFSWNGEKQVLIDLFKTIKEELLTDVKDIVANMEKTWWWG